MKYLILIGCLTYLVGCSTKPVKKELTYSDRLDLCISKYLDKGINSKGSVTICKTILERKE